jgi:hypothetical protein
MTSLTRFSSHPGGNFCFCFISFFSSGGEGRLFLAFPRGSLIGGDHKYAFGILVRHIENLEVSPNCGLADFAARLPGSPHVLTASSKIFNLLFRDAVAVNDLQ